MEIKKGIKELVKNARDLIDENSTDISYSLNTKELNIATGRKRILIKLKRRCLRC